MSKILYFTTAQDNKKYPEYLSNWTVSPNLSNQNFHNKLIRALSLAHEVEVISVRPINKNFKLNELPEEIVKEEKITWKYVRVKNSRIDKFINLSRRINHILEDKYDDNTTIFVDILNLPLLQNAYRLSKSKKLKIIGICTDNPLNISFANKYFTDKTIELTKALDGYISLTTKINEMFNDGKKPFVIIDGVTEQVDVEGKPNIDSEYIYFGGSLMREYGVYSLVDAFNKLENKNIKLVLAGHHEPKDFKDYIQGNPNIIYVGALPYHEVIRYEKHAICAVNPRPINPQIDNYSIPSKTLEYLAAGALTITVDNNLLNKRYEKCLIWAKSGYERDLLDALNKAISMSKEEKEEMISTCLRTIKKYTSFESLCKIIDEALF